MVMDERFDRAGLVRRLRELALAAPLAEAVAPRSGRPIERHTAWVLCVTESRAVLAAPMDPAIRMPADAVVVAFGWSVVDVSWIAAGVSYRFTLQAHPRLERTKFLEQSFRMLAHAVRGGADLCVSNRATVGVILAMIAEELVSPTMTEGGAIDKRRQAFYRIRAFMIDHMHEPFQLTDVATAADLTGHYVNRIVKTFTGMRFTEFVNFGRLERARQMLIHAPEKTGHEVAEDCGFNSFGYFVRKFRMIYGVPPMQMRRRCFRRGGAADLSVGSRIRGFAALSPEPPGHLISAAESLPQYQVVIANVSARGVTIHEATTDGALDTLGLVPPGGRWPMGVSPGVCLALKELDGSLIAGYRMPARLAQILVPERNAG